VHAAEHEGRPERRPLARAELQAFFDAADDLVEKAACSRRKGQLAAFRDATLFKVVYAWGIDGRERVVRRFAAFTDCWVSVEPSPSPALTTTIPARQHGTPSVRCRSAGGRPLAPRPARRVR
jgi:hypothetical protein